MFQRSTFKDVQAMPLFPAKLRWVRHKLEQHLLPAEADIGPMRIEVSRANLLQGALDHFLGMEPAEFCRAFRYRIASETDFYQDVGGVTREIYMLYSEALFSPASGLFIANNAGDIKYQIDPQSGDSREALDFFIFAGRLLGKAVLDGYHVSAHLVAPLYKLLLRRPVTMEDVQSVDSEVHQSLTWMQNNSVTNVMFETFSVEEDDATTNWPPQEAAATTGSAASRGKKVYELVPNGAKMDVTDDNKEKYVKARIQWIAKGRASKQTEALCQGFWEVCPATDQILRVLNVSELEQLMCGQVDIDCVDWRAHTQYTGDYNNDSQVVQWWWEAISALSPEEKQVLLQFATGTSIVPVGGFKELQSVPGKSCKFTIAVDPTGNCILPRAHTCFNRVDIPDYESKVVLEANLRIVLESEVFGFGMAE